MFDSFCNLFALVQSRSISAFGGWIRQAHLLANVSKLRQLGYFQQDRYRKPRAGLSLSVSIWSRSLSFSSLRGRGSIHFGLPFSFQAGSLFFEFSIDWKSSSDGFLSSICVPVFA